jgi:uncharacterized protein
VTVERLRAVGDAERALRALGFRELRVRHHGDLARIELPADEIARAALRAEEVARAVREAGFRFVTLDLQGLRTGGADGAAVAAPSAGAARPSEEDA